MPSKLQNLPRCSLTVCASLVHNPMNLGALCRTAEVFGLRELVVPSLHCCNDPNFRKLAVSAQQWQPLSECLPEHLPHWLEHQRGQGTTLVALTRHPQAISLVDFRFPRNAALLLGRELTGIPQPLIEQCDWVVEIPQAGRVDSLNVSTAAAIAAYTYLTQATRSSPPSDP
jgi:tRNA guanosine-2'-O-methyltransferase